MEGFATKYDFVPDTTSFVISFSAGAF